MLEKLYSNCMKGIRKEADTFRIGKPRKFSWTGRASCLSRGWWYLQAAPNLQVPVFRKNCNNNMKQDQSLLRMCKPKAYLVQSFRKQAQNNKLNWFSKTCLLLNSISIKVWLLWKYLWENYNKIARSKWKGTWLHVHIERKAKIHSALTGPDHFHNYPSQMNMQTSMMSMLPRNKKSSAWSLIYASKGYTCKEYGEKWARVGKRIPCKQSARNLLNYGKTYARIG